MTHFEYHFTFDFSAQNRTGITEESWQLFCKKLGWKYLTIDNYNAGHVVSRHMMASFDQVVADDKEWHDNTMQAVQTFCDGGFIPVRVKVEKQPPKFGDEHLLFGEYYETHMKINTDIAPNITKAGIGFSKNIIKDYYMTTIRTARRSNYSEHLFTADEIKDKFGAFGIKPFDIVTEHCILDTNIIMDNDWLRIDRQ